MRYIFLVLILLACGRGNANNPPAEAASSECLVHLQERFVVEFEAAKAEADQATGWPSAVDCDATLWAGIAASIGLPVKLNLAEYHDGEIHRRPESSGECYPDGSPSTISNDMLTGYLAGLWALQDREAVHRLAAYGEHHTWKMGEGDPFRTILRNGIGLVGRMLYSLSSGADDRIYRHLAGIYGAASEEFEEHLQVEEIFLEGEVSGGLNDKELGRLTDLAGAHPDDRLFQAAAAVYTGEQERACTVVMGAAPAPGYVRGAPTYGRIHWLKAAKMLLDKVTKQS